jgi:cytochrome c
MSSKTALLSLAALAAVAAPAMAQDAAAGGAIFKQRCQTCHTAPAGQPHGIGPNLAGVVGRKAASTAFAYSPALMGSGLTWNKPTLDRFLSGPSKMVPGTRMLISVPDPKERADLIAYLGGLK